MTLCLSRTTIVPREISLIQTLLSHTNQPVHLVLLSGLGIAKIRNSSYDNMVNTTKVHTICLDHNELRKLDGKAFEYFPFLEYLNLKRNFIERFLNLSYFRYMKVLDISGNRITTLDGISNCTGLEVLDVTKNLLPNYESLREVTECRNLTNLDYRWNSLSEDVEKEVFDRIRTKSGKQLYIVNGEQVGHKVDYSLFKNLAEFQFKKMLRRTHQRKQRFTNFMSSVQLDDQMIKKKVYLINLRLRRLEEETNKEIDRAMFFLQKQRIQNMKKKGTSEFIDDSQEDDYGYSVPKLKKRDYSYQNKQSPFTPLQERRIKEQMDFEFKSKGRRGRGGRRVEAEEIPKSNDDQFREEMYDNSDDIAINPYQKKKKVYRPKAGGGPVGKGRKGGRGKGGSGSSPLICRQCEKLGRTCGRCKIKKRRIERAAKKKVEEKRRLEELKKMEDDESREYLNWREEKRKKKEDEMKKKEEEIMRKQEEARKKFEEAEKQKRDAERKREELIEREKRMREEIMRELQEEKYGSRKLADEPEDDGEEETPEMKISLFPGKEEEDDEENDLKWEDVEKNRLIEVTQKRVKLLEKEEEDRRKRLEEQQKRIEELRREEERMAEKLSKSSERLRENEDDGEEERFYVSESKFGGDDDESDEEGSKWDEVEEEKRRRREEKIRRMREQEQNLDTVVREKRGEKKKKKKKREKKKKEETIIDQRCKNCKRKKKMCGSCRLKAKKESAGKQRKEERHRMLREKARQKVMKSQKKI